MSEGKKYSDFYKQPAGNADIAQLAATEVASFGYGLNGGDIYSGLGILMRLSQTKKPDRPLVTEHEAGILRHIMNVNSGYQDIGPLLLELYAQNLVVHEVNNQKSPRI